MNEKTNRKTSETWHLCDPLRGDRASQHRRAQVVSRKCGSERLTCAIERALVWSPAGGSRKSRTSILLSHSYGGVRVSPREVWGEDLRCRWGLWRGREGDWGGRNGGRCILERGGGWGSPSSSPSFLPPPPPSSPHSLPPSPSDLCDPLPGDRASQEHPFFRATRPPLPSSSLLPLLPPSSPFFPHSPPSAPSSTS